MARFDLKTANGKTVTWDGETWEDAALRFVDCTGETVIAWREAKSESFGIHVGVPRGSHGIVDPAGDPA